jgi:hypothetical protein
MKTTLSLATLTIAALAGVSQAAITLSAKTSFGGGDGWRAPGEIVAGDVAGSATGTTYNYLTAASTERGIAYNPTNNHLYLVSRAGGNNLRILDGTTGADIGSIPLPGVSGGSGAVVNMIATDANGVIYLNNLTVNATTSVYKVYRFANESSAPTVAYSGTLLPGARVGDSFDLFGTGTGTTFVTGYGTTAATGNNGYGILTTTDGTSFGGSSITFPVSPAAGGTAAGDFRLGITFTTSANNVLGKQTGTVARNTSYSGTTGTSVNVTLTAGSETAMDYAVVDGKPLLATVDVGPSTASVNAGALVFRVYDVSNLNSPAILGSLRIPAASLALNANGNLTGQVKFGAIVDDTATIYALTTNNGLQAFTFTIPEPTSLSLLAGMGVLGLRRRK